MSVAGLVDDGMEAVRVSRGEPQVHEGCRMPFDPGDMGSEIAIRVEYYLWQLDGAYLTL
jgi:hypothetical protein